MCPGWFPDPPRAHGSGEIPFVQGNPCVRFREERHPDGVLDEGFVELVLGVGGGDLDALALHIEGPELPQVLGRLPRVQGNLVLLVAVGIDQDPIDVRDPVPVHVHRHVDAPPGEAIKVQHTVGEIHREVEASLGYEHPVGLIRGKRSG